MQSTRPVCLPLCSLLLRRNLTNGGSRQRCSLATLGLAGVLLVLGGCSSTTLFQSSFNANPPQSPPVAPAQTQAVGTINVSGNVKLVGPLPNMNASGNWAELNNPGEVGGTQAIASMVCNFSQQSLGPGTYTLVAVLYIPVQLNKKAATVEFDGPGPPGSNGFWHLDFGPDNTVHVNDGATFGTFPRNRPFTLSLTLTVGASPTAHIQLFGAGASGSMDVTSGIPNVAPVAVNFWMGVQYSGVYQVQNIVVTYKK